MHASAIVMFDARLRLALLQGDEGISLDLAVTEEVVAPLDPGDLEAGLSQGSDHLSLGDAREASRATVIF
jgi:hypothetical protein